MGVDNESYLTMTSPTPCAPPQAFPFTVPEQTKEGFLKPGGRGASVRYTKEPKSTSDESSENASLMTAADARTSRNIVERSVSAVSRLSGPGWRSNMKGDYIDLSPICTKVGGSYEGLFQYHPISLMPGPVVLGLPGDQRNGISGQQEGLTPEKYLTPKKYLTLKKRQFHNFTDSSWRPGCEKHLASR